MIPGDLLSAFPHRQFHTLPGLLDSRAALPNSYPNAMRAMQGGSLYHLYDGLWYDPAERRTHDLPCERRTCYRLIQPDTVEFKVNIHTLESQLYKSISGSETVYVFRCGHSFSHTIPTFSQMIGQGQLSPCLLFFNSLYNSSKHYNISILCYLYIVQYYTLFVCFGLASLLNI